MNDHDRAINAYESALRHNPSSIETLTLVAAVCRSSEKYGKAAEYFQRLLNIHDQNGEVWGALGHCYLMMDDLQKVSYSNQRPIMPTNKPFFTSQIQKNQSCGTVLESFTTDTEATSTPRKVFLLITSAFSAVLRMEPNFEKSNEIYFRLGIIYKQEQKYENSLEV
jgi:tetratricopeptide (TPR) repeat protein